MARVRIDFDDTQLVVTPEGYLSSGFAAYVAVTRQAGAHYDKKRKAQVLHLDLLPELVEGLVGAGFTPVPVPGLSHAVHTRVHALRAQEKDIKTQEGWENLYSFQKDGTLFLALRKDAVLADDMGLGKTAQAIMALPPGMAAIVVCPNVVKHNWANEIARWRPDLSPFVVKKRADFRLPRKYYEVVILNYELLPTELHTLERKGPFVLIADEAHYLKNAKTQRTQRFRMLATLASRRWLLTGTPLMNKPPELWGVLRAADLHTQAFGSWYSFVSCMGGHKGPFGIEWGGTPKEEAAKAFAKVALRREKEEVLKQLPSKTYRQIRVDYKLSKEKKNEHMGIMRELVTLPEMKWQGIDGMSRVRAELAYAKIGAAVALAMEYEETGTPLVVFSHHKTPVIALGEREGWECIHGDVNAETRAAIVEDFQKGLLKGIAITIQAGSEGITLTRASNMVFVDRSWNPMENSQAEDRIHRIGQENACQYIDLVCEHPLDEALHQTLAIKHRMVEKVVRSTDRDNSRIDKLEKLANQMEEVMGNG